MRKYLTVLGAAAVCGGVAIFYSTAMAAPNHSSTHAAIAATSSTTTTLNLDCEPNYPFNTINFTMAQTVTMRAPASTTAGASISVTDAAAPWTVPTSEAGVTISQLSDVAITYQVSGGTVDSASVSGGSGLGSGTPTASVSGDQVTLNVPGPLTAGSTVTLPTVTTKVKAGSSGSVTFQMAGSSYSSPGVTATVTVPNGSDPPITDGSGCYPSPDPVLSSTSIL